MEDADALMSPELVASTQKELNGMETYFHAWLGLGQGSELTEDDVGRMTKLLYAHVGTPVGWDAEEWEREYSSLTDMSTLQRATTPLVQAYLNLRIRNFKAAYTSLMWVERLIGFFLERDPSVNDYFSGWEYICKLLRVDARLRDGTATLSTLTAFEQIHGKYEELEPRGKSLVWVAKWMLNQAVQGRHEEATKDLEKVISKHILQLFIGKYQFL
jgi:hypothetical protein